MNRTSHKCWLLQKEDTIDTGASDVLLKVEALVNGPAKNWLKEISQDSAGFTAYMLAGHS